MSLSRRSRPATAGIGIIAPSIHAAFWLGDAIVRLPRAGSTLLEEDTYGHEARCGGHGWGLGSRFPSVQAALTVCVIYGRVFPHSPLAAKL